MEKLFSKLLFQAEKAKFASTKQVEKRKHGRDNHEIVSINITNNSIILKISFKRWLTADYNDFRD